MLSQISSSSLSWFAGKIGDITFNGFSVNIDNTKPTWKKERYIQQDKTELDAQPQASQQDLQYKHKCLSFLAKKLEDSGSDTTALKSNGWLMY